MSKPSKCARVSKMQPTLPFVSGRALSALLTQLSPQDLQPGRASDAVRHDLRRERDLLVKTSTPFGPIHQTITANTKDGTMPIEVQHPLAMMHYVSARSSCLADLVADAAASNPPSHARPWHIVMYMDEVLPGNQLAHKAARKGWHWYWSIAELGPAALADEVCSNSCL